MPVHCSNLKVFLRLFLCLLLMLSGCKTKPEQQNLIIVTIDTLRADGLGCYGNSLVKTPVLDRLIAQGSLFLDASAEVPITNPSHCSLFTGCYPYSHGVVNFGYRLTPDKWTLTQGLRARGYRTAAFVSGFSLVARVSGLERDFEVYDDRWSNEQQRTDRPAGEATDAALTWLDSIQQPFVLWLHYFDPHKSYSPPKEYGLMYLDEYAPATTTTPPLLRAQSGPALTAPPRNGVKPRPDDSVIDNNWRRYLGEISYVDSQLNRLITYLIERRLWSDTALLITADHGESFGNDYWFRHVDRVYQSLLHIPLFMYLPHRKTPQLIEWSTRMIDVAPTLAEWFDLDYGDCDGHSLLSNLTNEVPPPPLNSFALAPGRKVPWSQGTLHSVRDDQWKLIRYEDERRAELFNLAEDPTESTDQSASRPDLVGTMQEQLTTWLSSFQPRTGGAFELADADEEKLRALGYLQ